MPEQNAADSLAEPQEREASPRWQKARLPELAPETTADEALSQILLAGVEHMRGNEACVSARSHVEGIHQMRVAVRRLRSCLALHAGFLPDTDRRHINGELRWLIGELGPARDFDVFVSDILAPVVQRLGGEPRLGELATRVEEHRDEAYVRARTAIADRRYTGLMLLLVAWAEGRRWRDHLAPAQLTVLDRPCVKLAHTLIDQRYREVIAVGDRFASLDETERHKVRIAIKKVRYAVEFFASLYPKRRVVPFLELLKEMQDALGAGNDVAVARLLLRRVTRGLHGRDKGRLAYAAGLVVGWHSHTSGHLDIRLNREWQRLMTRQPFWPVPAKPAVATGGLHPAAPAAPAETTPPAVETAARPGNGSDDGPSLQPDIRRGGASSPRSLS